MKEFKYTIDGKEYKVAIAEIDENNVADITVNGESYKVQLEKEEVAEKVPEEKPSEEKPSEEKKEE